MKAGAQEILDDNYICNHLSKIFQIILNIQFNYPNRFHSSINQSDLIQKDIRHHLSSYALSLNQLISIIQISSFCIILVPHIIYEKVIFVVLEFLVNLFILGFTIHLIRFVIVQQIINEPIIEQFIIKLAIIEQVLIDLIDFKQVLIVRFVMEFIIEQIFVGQQ